MYYLATPYAKTGIKSYQLDHGKLNRNKEIAQTLEKLGIQIFLPQRDVDQTLPGKKILNKELSVIRSCEGVIIVLSDTRGIYLEAGYAKALGKKVIALKVAETREMSDWGYAFFDFVAQSEEELTEYLNRK
jgi:nucleoside 2-deoxyribosyltransferase